MLNTFSKFACLWLSLFPLNSQPPQPRPNQWHLAWTWIYAILYLPQLFWRRLYNFHMSLHHSDILMPRLHKPGTLWPLRMAVSGVSWKDNKHTHRIFFRPAINQQRIFKSQQQSQCRPSPSWLCYSLIHIVKHFCFYDPQNSSSTMWLAIKMSANQERRASYLSDLQLDQAYKDDNDRIIEEII